MSSSSEQVDLVVKTMAQTAVDNETYFGDLDAVVATVTSASRWRGASRSCWPSSIPSIGRMSGRS